MSTSFGDVKDTTLQKLCDSLTASLVRPDGTTYSAAPNAFKDRFGTALGSAAGTGPIGSGQAGDASEVDIHIKINPGGLSGTCKIILHAPQGVQDLVGVFDNAVLATKLV